MRAWRVADLRAAERARLAQVPEGALMQRAAAGAAAVCARQVRATTPRGLVTGSRVVVLVGSGGNGGDALWVGALLARRGARVDAVLLGASVHDPGLVALRAAGGRVVDLRSEVDGLSRAVAVVAAADLVVDGIVGIGGRAGLGEPAASVVAAISALATVVALDLPSGIDPDTGQGPQVPPGGHGGAEVITRAEVVVRAEVIVRADVTVSFGAVAAGLLVPAGARAAGQVVVVDLGFGPELPEPAAVEQLEAADVARRWPVPGRDDDKYRRGVVGIVAGSSTYPGAAVLAVGGALRAGVGMVRYVGPGKPTALVQARWPEDVMGVGRVQAWLVGSGVDPGVDDGADDGVDDGQVAAIRAALAGPLPVVVDAGALGMLPARRSGPTLLTPHAGELAGLLTAWGGADGVDRGAIDRGAVERRPVERRPVEHAQAAARLTGATVLLKGSMTVIAAPDGRLRTQAQAPSWLATAGAGDVLAGIAAALLSAGLDPFDAGALAAFVHGTAATRASAGGPIAAQDVIAALPATIAGLLGGR